MKWALDLVDQLRETVLMSEEGSSRLVHFWNSPWWSVFVFNVLVRNSVEWALSISCLS